MTDPITTDLRTLWINAGGDFHGPNVETGTMPEDKLLPFLQSLIAERDTATAALQAMCRHCNGHGVIQHRGKENEHTDPVPCMYCQAGDYISAQDERITTLMKELEACRKERDDVCKAFDLYRENHNLWLANRAAVKAELAAAKESQRLTQKARQDDLARLQQKCSDWGTYWRASDAHGVNLNMEQAVEILQDALGVEVEIAQAKAAPVVTLPQRYSMSVGNTIIETPIGRWMDADEVIAAIVAAGVAIAPEVKS